MRFILLFLHITSYVFLINGSVNYCGAKMCGYTDAHTFCQYLPGPGPLCNGYIPSLLSEMEKARVLGRLNKRRAEVARGLRGLPPAGDMLKLRWVEDLEREAQRWADQCTPLANVEVQDTCRDLYSISVGQCVASVVGEAPGLRPESMVDMWYMQKMYYTGNVTEYTKPIGESHLYRDFAQMTWSQTYMVGCGRSKFMIPWGTRVRSVERLVCNFAPRKPVESRPLWYPGAPTAACPSRSQPDPEIPELCSYPETVEAILILRDGYHVKSLFYCDEYETLLIFPEFDDPEKLSVYSTAVGDTDKNILLDVILELEISNIDTEIGRLDEMYLTKLAIATIKDSTMTEAYNSPKKRDVIEKISEGETENSLAHENKTTHQKSLNDIGLNTYSKKRKQSKLLGRPENYNLEDLNDVNNSIVENTHNKKNIIQYAQNMYDDYEIKEKQDDIVNITSTSEEQLVTFDGFTAESSTPAFFVEINPVTSNNSRLLVNIADEMVRNLTAAEFLNDSTVDEKLLDDYLSDPETARELQTAIKHMEHNLAVQPASSKMRREIRNLGEEINPDLLKEIERNKTRDRGPVVNMMLKYIPYLKPYEKTILGDASKNTGCTINKAAISMFCQCLVFIILFLDSF